MPNSPPFYNSVIFPASLPLISSSRNPNQKMVQKQGPTADPTATEPKKRRRVGFSHPGESSSLLFSKLCFRCFYKPLCSLLLSVLYVLVLNLDLIFVCFCGFGSRCWSRRQRLHQDLPRYDGFYAHLPDITV